MIGIWGIGAGIIVNLAGLRGIPTELYDAARIDGAGWWASLRHVTLPMMSPIIFYTLILAVVDVLQYFLVPLVINNGTGEPGGTTAFFNLYLYKNFFTYQNMAYGATLAWLLFIVTLVDHAGPVPDLAPLGLLRGGALRHGRRGDAPGRGGPGHGRARVVAPAAPAPAAARRDALVRADVPDGRAPRGVPVADAAGGDGVAQDARPAVRDQRAVPAVAAADVRLAGQDATTSTSCRSRAAARPMALVKPGRTQSQFVDPANPAAAPIVWDGAWRTLERAWTLAPAWQNFADVWAIIDFPRLLFNTIAIAVIGMIGTIASCTLVAYGFARFRFPGRSLLFTLLIATIFLPGAVTLVPTYTIFAKIGWVGTWLPLLVPTFFANAFDVFLIRQYMLTIPREMDEAASIDGAGPVPDADLGDPAAGVARGRSRSRSSTSSTRGTTSSTR